MLDIERATLTGKDAAEIFAAFAAKLRFDDLPPEIVAQVHRRRSSPPSSILSVLRW
jgi:hypothetical protein